MGYLSHIQWTDSTFNAWWGCVKVSEACRNCYAETTSNRFHNGLWGANASRRFFGDKHWNEPRRWNRKAAKAGVRHRVFCGSMMDVAEILKEGHPQRDEMTAARLRLWALIKETPHLDWLLLSKRPENYEDTLPGYWFEDGFPDNVWLGCTVEDQAEAETRIPHLLSVPAKVRFLSCEPLLGPVDLRPYIADLHWVIAGGESGPNSRPMHPNWVRSLRDLCLETETAFHYKQWGAFKPLLEFSEEERKEHALAPRFHDEGWPTMLRVGKKNACRNIDGRTWDMLPA